MRTSPAVPAALLGLRIPIRNTLLSEFIECRKTKIYKLFNRSHNHSSTYTSHSHAASSYSSDEIIPGKIVMISQFGDNNFQFGMTNAVLGLDTELSLVSEVKSLEEIKANLKSL